MSDYPRKSATQGVVWLLAIGVCAGLAGAFYLHKRIADKLRFELVRQ